MKLKLNDPAMMVATVCGVGLLPKAPGTWGSAPALPLPWLLHGPAGPLACRLGAAVARGERRWDG